MSVNLKVKVVEGNDVTTRTYRLPASASIHECMQQIRERMPDGGRDHLLFRPNGPEDVVGVWLKPNKTLESYDINSNDVLWFRKKHHLVKVKLADDTVKTILVDLTANLRDLVLTVAQKIRLSRSEEYSLQVEGSPRWLRVNLPLTEQANADDIIVLKKRLFINDSEVDTADPVQLHLVYVQNRDAMQSGMHQTTKEEAALFGALAAHIDHGIFSSTNHKAGFLKIDKVVPPPWAAKPKDIEPLVLSQWKNLGAMKQPDAKLKYLKLCMTLRTYGVTMYNVTINTAPRGKKPQLQPLRLGFTSTTILRMSPDGRNVLHTNTLEQLRKWSYTEADVTLDFGEFEDEPLVAQTPQGDDISSLIAAYIEILVRRQKELVPEDSDAATAVETQSLARAKGTAAAGYTSSAQSGGQSSQRGLEEVCDLESCRRCILEMQGPIARQRGISAEVVKSALTPDQLTQQLGSNAERVAQLVPRLADAARAGDAAQLAELSRALAVATQSLLQTGLAAASLCSDPVQQQRILDASKAVTDSLAAYIAALERIDPTAPEAELARAVGEAQRAQAAVEMALAAVTGAARGGAVDVPTEALVVELAKNVQAAAKEFCRDALTESGNAPPVAAACREVLEGAQELVDAVVVLAPVIADPGAQAKVAERIKSLRDKMAGVVTAMAQSGKSIAGVTNQMKIVDTAVRQLVSFMENPRIDMDPKRLAFLRSAGVAMSETNRVAAQKAMNETSAASAQALKQELPTLVGRAKALSVADDEERERMLHWARQIALGTKSLVQMTTCAPGDAPPYERVRETAQKVNGAVRCLVGDDEFAVHRVALIDGAKAAAASVMRVACDARDVGAKRPAQQREALGAAADASADAVVRLLAAVRQASGREGDERVNTNALAEAAEAFCPQVVRDLVVPVKQASGALDPADPLRAQAGAGCQQAARDVQRLLEETRGYKELGRLADLEVAAEGFRAAEARFQALVYAADAGGRLPEQLREGTATREEATALVPAAIAGIPGAVESIAAATRAGGSAAPGVREMSAGAHRAVTALRALAAHSRFKRERTLVLDAGKDLMAQMNRLLDALARIARDPADEAARRDADDASALVCRAAADVSRAAFGDDEGDEGAAPVAQADVALERAAAESLQRTAAEVQRSAGRVGEADAAARAASEADASDAKAQVAAAVLDSVQALVQTTASVVAAAHAAQVELVKALAAPSTKAMYSRDPELAQGLIDASEQVAQAVRELTGGLTPEAIETLSQQELVAHAEAVSRACEALAAACRAGTRAGAGASGLVDAARAVSEATRALMEAAKMIEEIPEVDALDDIENFGIDAYTLREIKQQMKIVELEKQLERAKRRRDRLMHAKVQDAHWTNV
eukprot:m51a1_g6118 hypothetical protein (1374) ;mRNA; f:129019-134991